MTNRFTVDLSNLANHPRFGARPMIRSGPGFVLSWLTQIVLRNSKDSIPYCVRMAYAYRSQTVFPQTRVVANIKKQNYSVIPRDSYYDVLKTCCDCERPFIFFAKEQQFWYEELQFVLDSDCIRCFDCRSATRQVRERFKRYSKDVKRDDLSEHEFTIFISDVAFLWERKILSDHQKLRRFGKMANKRLADGLELSDINRLIAALVAATS